MSFDRRKVREGKVISDKMDCTLVVVVERRRAHRLYKKSLTRRTRYFVHDAENSCKVGDVIQMMETRPISKTKRWRVLKIVSRGDIADIQPEDIGAEGISGQPTQSGKRSNGVDNHQGETVGTPKSQPDGGKSTSGIEAVVSEGDEVTKGKKATSKATTKTATKATAKSSTKTNTTKTPKNEREVSKGEESSDSHAIDSDAVIETEVPEAKAKTKAKTTRKSSSKVKDAKSSAVSEDPPTSEPSPVEQEEQD